MKFELTKEKGILKGIYQITNLITNDIYIGSTTVSFVKRYYKYKSSYKRYIEGATRSCHPYLFNAITKYGWDNFRFSILESLKLDEFEIRLKEECYINELNPKYNICKRPSRGGSPNSGRKLSDEWKKRIGEKSKNYKHTNNADVYAKMVLKNKNTSSLYQITKNDEIFIGSLIECSIKFNVDSVTIISWSKKENNNLGWKVIKIKSQRKKLKVFFENEILIFSTLGECDRHFNMWRGYTSTKTLRSELILDKYHYEFIEDIVQ